MAYTLNINFAASVQDGLGGTQDVNLGITAPVPTEPAFCGSGTATTTPAAVAMGSIGTAKLFVFINDGAQEITLDIGTDTITVGASGSTTRANLVVLTSLPATPEVSTASSTSAYRTLVME